MIGAWIPDDIVVLDLDRHEGKPDGVESFRGIKEKYNINVNFVYDTFCIKTMSGGFHAVFELPKNTVYRQGVKAPGIDLKTHSGYIIAAGSPGYEILCDSDPMELPENLCLWLESCEQQKGRELQTIGKEADGGAAGIFSGSGFDKPQLLPASQLKRILNKISVENFRSNDRWLQFITSCIATAGEAADVLDILDDWSKKDREYSDDRSITKRIDSFHQQGGITVGTFIKFLQEENISDYIIRQVTKFDNINRVLIEQEAKEYELPFSDPDYQALSIMPEAEEFFNFRGNTAAAALLAHGLKGKIIFVEGEEKRFYYFDGSKWDRLTDIHGVIHTILYRIMKFKYAAKRSDGQSSANDSFFSVIIAIADTSWKMNTIREFSGREGIFNDIVQWDSPAIKETVTTKDGVIDFRGGQGESARGTADRIPAVICALYQRRNIVSNRTETIC